MRVGSYGVHSPLVIPAKAGIPTQCIRANGYNETCLIDNVGCGHDRHAQDGTIKALATSYCGGDIWSTDHCRILTHT